MRPRTLQVLAFIFSLIAVAIAHESLFGAPEQEEETPRTISAEEFLQSPAAEFFLTEEYGRALESLEALAKQYPDDPLILRYQAITLDRLGRSEEAIRIFQDLLRREPNHAPTRYFLGQAYERSARREEAVREWRWLVDNAEGTAYETWARAAVERTKVVPPVPLGPVVRPEVRPWSVAVRYGYEFDSNVILKPNDNSLATSEDRTAGRQAIDLRTRYRLFSRRDLAVDAHYDFAQSLHDDGLSEFNFTGQDIGLHVRKRVNMVDRPVVVGGAYSFLPGFLDGNLFSVRNRWTVSADVRWTPRTRTELFDELTVSNFGPDGFAPARTSRDGLYHDVGIAQYWYSANYKRYLFVREEFTSAHTRGDNFDRLGETTQVGIHTPLVWKTELDVSGGWDLGFYPKFSSISSRDLSRRRDLIWDLYAAISRPLTSRISVRAFYRFANATNRNNFFDYDRHIGGVQFIYA